MLRLKRKQILIGTEQANPQILSSPEGKNFFKVNDNDLKETYEKYSNYSRSLPRDGFLSLHCLDKLKLEFGDKLSGDKVGMYTAFHNGPNLYSLADKIRGMEHTEGILYFKKWWPPKQHFRQNAPIRANHFSMSLGLHGPQMCFVDPQKGLYDAFQAAQIDLYLGIVNLALVISAFSFEDLLTTSFYTRDCDTLYESAVVLVLEKTRNEPQDLGNPFESIKFDKGICSPFFNGDFNFLVEE